MYGKSYYEMNEVERMFADDLCEQQKIGRGSTRGNYLTVSSLMRGFEVAPCSITRAGKTVEIPPSWMTKEGAIKKSKRGALEALFL